MGWGGARAVGGGEAEKKTNRPRKRTQCPGIAGEAKRDEVTASRGSRLAKNNKKEGEIHRFSQDSNQPQAWKQGRRKRHRDESLGRGSQNKSGQQESSTGR